MEEHQSYEQSDCETEEREMKIQEMNDSAETEIESERVSERERQPHEWGKWRFNQTSSKCRTPQSHFKTCTDIFIHHIQTLTANTVDLKTH